MSKPAVLRTVLTAALSIVLTSSTGRAQDVEAGNLLADKWCLQCHGVRADRLSPNLAAPTFPELAGEPSITEYSLRALLRTPHATMPQITFSPDEMDDLVSYILSLKPRH